VTDWFFVMPLVEDTRFRLEFHIALASLICVAVVNGFLSVFWVMRPEFRRPEFAKWLGENSTAFVAGILLSLTNLDALRILWSEMFYAQALSAPVALVTDRKVQVGGLVSTFLEDIPQFALQIVLAFKIGVVTKVLAATMTVTAIKLVFDLSRRILYAVYSKKKSLRQMQRRSHLINRVSDIPLELWTQKQLLAWYTDVRMALEELQRQILTDNLTGRDVKGMIASSGKLPGGLKVQKIGRDGFTVQLVMTRDCNQSDAKVELSVLS